MKPKHKLLPFLLICWSQTHAQLPNLLELNTAANGPNAMLAVGALDTNWYSAYGNASGPTSPFVPSVVVGNCAPGYWYNSPFPNANWIAYDFGAGCNHEPQGCVDLFFRRNVILPATNNCGQAVDQYFCLGMDFFADNSVFEIKVNGVQNYLYTLGADPYNFAGYQIITTVNLCEGWQTGLNTILIHIKSCPFAEGFLAQVNTTAFHNYVEAPPVFQTICQGEDFLGYASSGAYIDTLDCDTIRTINLNVLPSWSNTQTVSICENEAPYDGHYTSGVYADTMQAINGCDSIESLNLIVRPVYAINQTVNVCENETPYEGYSSSGVYIDNFQTAYGCDSIRTLNLTVLPISENNLAVSVCQHETPYEGHATSGLYVDTLTSANGCDSIRTLQLLVNQDYQVDTGITICAGASYNFNGLLVSNAGVYTDTLPTALGCDSVIVLDLKIAQTDFLGLDTTVCNAGEYVLTSPTEQTVWFDNTVGKTKKIEDTGHYWATISDVNGCEITDSIFVQFSIKSFVPNVFSPNDDGVNDCFLPNFSEPVFSTYRLSVFDRWGTLLFTTFNQDVCWNGDYKGKKCNPGVYAWFIEFSAGFCQKVLLKGDVTLLR